VTSRILIVLLALVLVAGLASCLSSPSSTRLGRVDMRLTDAPGDFEAINVVVDEVAVHRSGAATGEGDGDDIGEGADDDSLNSGDDNDVDEPGDVDDTDDADGAGDDDASSANGSLSGASVMHGGWEVVSTTQQTFDLMQLQNGTFTSLASASVPAGHYTQIRLRVAPGSTVVVNGQSHPLVIPSGFQSGIKLVSGFDVPAGGIAQLTLDFDGAKSIVVAGDGTYHLKPTIRVSR